jgi:type II secretory pathway component GspD/PulD (secretin)
MQHFKSDLFCCIGAILIFIGSVYPQKEDLAEKGVKVSKERISLDLKGVDIVELFRVLSLRTGLTIVPSKGVRGRISIFLNNVTFEDALDVILVSQGLAAEKKGNIIFIMTNDEYKRKYGREYIERRKFISFKLRYAKPKAVFDVLTQLKSNIGEVIVDEASGTVIIIDIPEKIELMEKAVKELDQPLETIVVDLNYADPEEIKNQLSEAITPGTGEVVVDTRSNKVIISDLPSKIEKLKKLVEALDEESRQVFIEAEIVQITLSDEFQHGIEWEKVFDKKNFDGLDFVGTFPLSPVPSAFQKISVGTIDRDKYNIVINFFKKMGDVKILSRPRIAVLNNQEAKILVGSREAYVTQTLSQAQTTTVTSESIEFIDVGVKLNVVPTINKEGFITMKIKPEVSTVKDTLKTSLGSVVPIVETSEAETVVKVKDGTMIMIAGLIKEEKRNDVTGVPVLSKIPVIGNLFRTQVKSKTRTEIVVFITPHLARGDKSMVDMGLKEYIPPDIMPTDLKDAIILKEIENIGKEEEPVLEEKKEGLKDRIKGLKKY